LQSAELKVCFSTSIFSVFLFRENEKVTDADADLPP
jgi:hypothetical protein